VVRPVTDRVAVLPDETEQVVRTSRSGSGPADRYESGIFGYRTY
jgi:hypothetical protein